MRHPGYKYLLAVLDWAGLVLAFVVAFVIHGSADRLWNPASTVFPGPAAFVFLYSWLCLGILRYANLYKINVFLTAAEQLSRILLAMVVAVLGVAVVSFFTKASFIPDSRLIAAYFFVTSITILAVIRIAFFRNLFLALARNRIYRRGALIVGTGPTARVLAANIRLSNPYGVNLVGFLDDDVEKGTDIVLGTKVVGSVKEGPALAASMGVAEILVALDDVSHQNLLETVDLFRQKRLLVKIASPLISVVPRRMFAERYGDVAVVGLAFEWESGLYELTKRILDVVLASLGIVLLLPLFLVLAVAIKLDSRGPVLYRQKRIGKFGKPFKFYKFRSMHVGTDQDVRRVHQLAKFISGEDVKEGATKIVDSSRVTWIGRLLRKYSIDELPQLFNVIKGDMSLVGPRPSLPYEWDHYKDWHKKRHNVIPGCTGIWQVNGRSEVGFDDMVVLDLYYIGNASLLLDLQLILKTIPVMLFGRGAG